MSKKKNKIIAQIAGVKEADSKYQLPIDQIRKDLFKNLIYTVFAVLLVVGMKVIGKF